MTARILLTALVLFPAFCSAQIYSSSTTITDVSNGSSNVGIGVPSPEEKLHINGAIRGNGEAGALRIGTTAGYLDIGPMNSSWAHLQTDRPQFYFNKSVMIDGSIQSYHSHDLVFGTYGATRMIVNASNGYVSIGGTAPAAKLNVLQSAGGWADGIRLSYAGKSWDIVSDTNGDRLVIAKDQSIVNGITLVNDKVAIGTTPDGDAKVQINYGSQVLKLLTGSSTSWYTLGVGVNDDGINFTNDSVIRGFKFNNANGNLMFINSSGNVGIGTLTPGSFKLAVNGKIWSQEVNVQMTNPGPDYVFEPDYDLKPLSEVESYIKANKHLPEVPSAKDMEKEGLNLKEMNLILLKKVEELTLHLIELEKKYNALIQTEGNK